MPYRSVGLPRVLGATLVFGVLVVACSAGTKGFPGDEAPLAGAGGETSGSAGTGTGGSAGKPIGKGGSGAGGSTLIEPGGAGAGGGTTVINACASPCGAEELCDIDHLGYDDNCNGTVDENCPCTHGQVHWCFRGDPSFRYAGSCKDGTERCNELSTFNECEGGKHANAADSCQIAAADGCKDISAAPFSQVSLANGTTGFSSDADAGSETYSLACPSGVSTCPEVSGVGAAAKFQPLQSGQYRVTYTKTVNGAAQSCNYSVYVGAGGLRIELGWDNAGKEVPGGGSTLKGPDLDLHVHRPGTTTPWGNANGNTDDCFYETCRAENYEKSGSAKPGPAWFSDDPAAAGAHNWTKKPAYKDNLCYFAPKGNGGVWGALDKGCHSPRLDLDNFGCDASEKNTGEAEFCAPENVNFDEVPTGTWIRVGVEYHGTCAPTLPTHPVIRIYCAGGQVAELGSHLAGGAVEAAGFAAPVTFSKADCGATFWLAADVFVTQNECSIECVVQPIYAAGGEKKPYFLPISEAQKKFGPPYPPTP